MSTEKKSAVTKTNYLVYSAFIFVAFIGGIALAWGVQQWSSDNKADVVATGVEAYGGDFMLEAPWGQSGLPDYRGKLVMAYFGFASCPDVCPTSLGVMKAAMATLSDAEQSEIRGLLISIDPERDTAKKVEQYAQYFHPNFHGLSGTTESVAHVAKQYGALYRRVETPDSSMDYTMDHSSVIYLIDQQGVLREKLSHGVTPAEVAGKLKQYL
uniref:Cytochrome oxidase biogenesis protein Sco1/SenC/PrrC, putative copper metallochaperone n=1 Tax=uncultured Thiotrichaceae bacterium TaxID=298394 RepID=A0A6S6TYB1_9GAMM|nr:MAG: Cytochrome oxidase biogenesis protein Sco1/SenC/PrrC, putative copper metallochaperone [uncultured Thiotrichaceae bacterium]